MADLSNPGRAFRSRMNANTITADAIVVRNQAQIGGVTAATTADTSRVANDSHPLTTVDSAPNTNNANHLVTSKGVADAIDTAINGLVASAPGTLDTLNEIAAAIGDDATFQSTVTNAIATKHPVINTSARLNANLVGGGAVDNTEFGYVSGVTSAIQAQLDGKEPALAANQKIDWSVSGSELIDSSRYTTYIVGDGGLTQNNFTDADHSKLDGIAAGAEVNVQSDWDASAGDAQILNKPALVTSFTGLSDTPSSLSGQGGKTVQVNSGATALEFVTPSSGGGISVYAYVALDAGDKTLASGDFSGLWYIVDYGVMVQSTHQGSPRHPVQESHTGIVSSLTNGTDVSLTVPSGEAGGYLVHATLQFHGPGYVQDLKNIHFELFSVTRNITLQQKLWRQFTNSSTSVQVSDINLGFSRFVYLNANEKIACRMTSSSVGDIIGKFAFGFAKIH